MPNQPKTPARTFRLSDTTIQKVDEMTAAMGTLNRSETIRGAVDAIHELGVAMLAGLPEGISLEAMAAAESVTPEAMSAADEAAWLDVHMPRGEANRRLLKALAAAAPFLVKDARRDERQRTLRDVITRLEGHAPGDVKPVVIDSLRSLLD